MVLRFKAVYENGTVPPTGVVPLFTSSAPLAWPRGEDGTIVVSVVDQAGAPVNLTGYSAALGVRLFDFDTAPLFVKTGALSGTPTDGTVTFTVATADTSLLSPDRYRYDVWIKSGGARHQVVPASFFEIVAADTLTGEGP